jgi:hypothetical protein
MTDPRFARWIDALEARHLAQLRFSEAVRALRALSASYVERRERLAKRGGLDSAGKRAAYALYFSPLHYLTVREILTSVRATSFDGPLLDVGCGAGATGAAWAAAAGVRTVHGIDSHPWAVSEAAWTYRTFELDGDARQASAARLAVPRNARALVAGWVVNELDERDRDIVRARLVAAAARGLQILVVEPIATRVSPWWPQWVDAFAKLGGRADEWEFEVELPDLLTRLGRAAGLKPGALKARSLYVPATARSL